MKHELRILSTPFIKSVLDMVRVFISKDLPSRQVDVNMLLRDIS